MKNIFLLLKYLVYLLKAKRANGIHSPFVFELYNKVIKESPDYYEFAPIELLRERLKHSKEVIETIDFGAEGSHRLTKGGTEIKAPLGVWGKKVKDIVRKSAISSKQGRLLFRLVNFVQPRNMIEMGTSLGISTLYQHKACPGAEMITMEGSPGTSAMAGINFNILKAGSIKRVVGDFAETLPGVIKSLSFVDYVFVDGNHRKEATIGYFYKFLPLASSTCVFVFDDIRWSPGMYEAWEEIIKEPSVKVSIDLFSVGLVFFNPSQEKQHFVLKW